MKHGDDFHEGRLDQPIHNPVAAAKYLTNIFALKLGHHPAGPGEDAELIDRFDKLCAHGACIARTVTGDEHVNGFQIRGRLIRPPDPDHYSLPRVPRLDVLVHHRAPSIQICQSALYLRQKVEALHRILNCCRRRQLRKGFKNPIPDRGRHCLPQNAAIHKANREVRPYETRAGGCAG